MLKTTRQQISVRIDDELLTEVERAAQRERRPYPTSSAMFLPIGQVSAERNTQARRRHEHGAVT
jgi:hypothetical protein